MYRYTEKIGDQLTRTYEAETPKQVVELVMAVTMDIQSAIDVKIQAGAQLAKVDLADLTRQIEENLKKYVNERSSFA